MTNKEMIEQYIKDTTPTAQLDIVLAFAEVKVRYGATQKEVSELLGINDRSLRQYISNYRDEYEERVEELEAEVEPQVDISNLSRTITEEQLDAFVDSLFKSAVNGNARDKQLFIEFTGLTSEQVLTMQKAKAKSLRNWIRGELGNISQYMDTKSLGIMSESSALIYRGNKESANNPQNYINKDVADESFAKELMYWGLVHLNLLNGLQHPDTELVATAVRVDRLEKDLPETFNKFEVSKYAKGEPISEVKKTYTDEQWLKMLSEGGVFTQDEIEDIMYKRSIAKETTNVPTVDRVIVKQRASKYQDDLEVLLTVEDELKALMRGMPVEKVFNKTNKKGDKK